MNVANLENCKELYELSGWEQLDGSYWLQDNGGDKPVVYVSHEGITKHTPKWYEKLSPAYDAGFLLRKLPYKIKDEYQFDQFGVHLKQTGGGGWTIYFGEQGKDSEMYFNSADTPEDAACKLAIELFKSNILKREGK